MLHRIPTCRPFEIVGREVKDDPTYGDLCDTDVVSIGWILCRRHGVYSEAYEPRLASISALSGYGPNMDKKTVDPALFEQALFRKGWESVEELSLQRLDSHIWD